MSTYNSGMRARLLEQAFESFLAEGHSMHDTAAWGEYRERVLNEMDPKNPNPPGKEYRA